MVSFNVYRATASGAYVEGVCLTSDEKPIAGIANGSILYAVDTSDGSMTKFMYNQSGAEWIEVEETSSGGGEGGGGDGGDGCECNVVPVCFTATPTESEEAPLSVTCNLTAEEIFAADAAGKTLFPLLLLLDGDGDVSFSTYNYPTETYVVQPYPSFGGSLRFKFVTSDGWNIGVNWSELGGFSIDVTEPEVIGSMVVHDYAGTLDKTWKEIHDAMAAGVVPTLAMPDDRPDATFAQTDYVT